MLLPVRLGGPAAWRGSMQKQVCPFANASPCWDWQQEAVCIASMLNVTRVARNNISFGNLEKNKLI